MGGRLIGEALAECYMLAVDRHPLTPSEQLVLLVMAYHARDSDGDLLPARTYAMGWRVLGHHALGRVNWTAATKRDVARCIATLKKRGLITDEVEQDGRHKRYAVLPPRGG